MKFESFVLTAATADLVDEPAARPHADTVESKIGYAPVDPANATALGQYDLETLSSLVAALE